MISTKVSFTVNRAGIDQLVRGPLARATKNAADATAARARASATVKSGRYRDSIRATEVRMGPTGPTCSIVSDVPYSRSIEYLQRPVMRDALRRLSPNDFRG